MTMKLITTQRLLNKKDKSKEVMGDKEGSNIQPIGRGGLKQHG